MSYIINIKLRDQPATDEIRKILLYLGRKSQTNGNIFEMKYCMKMLYWSMRIATLHLHILHCGAPSLTPESYRSVSHNFFIFWVVFNKKISIGSAVLLFCILSTYLFNSCIYLMHKVHLRSSSTSKDGKLPY